MHRMLFTVALAANLCFAHGSLHLKFFSHNKNQDSSSNENDEQAGGVNLATLPDDMRNLFGAPEAPMDPPPEPEKASLVATAAEVPPKVMDPPAPAAEKKGTAPMVEKPLVETPLGKKPPQHAAAPPDSPLFRPKVLKRKAHSALAESVALKDKPVAVAKAKAVTAKVEAKAAPNKAAPAKGEAKPATAKVDDKAVPTKTAPAKMEAKAAPTKAAPAKAAPAKAAPAKVEAKTAPTKPATAKVDDKAVAAKAVPAKMEAKAAPTKAAPAKVTEKAAPAKAAPAKAAPAKVEAKAAPTKTAPTKVEAKAAPAKVEAKVAPAKVDTKASPAKAAPTKVAEPSKVTPAMTAKPTEKAHEKAIKAEQPKAVPTKAAQTKPVPATAEPAKAAEHTKAPAAKEEKAKAPEMTKPTKEAPAKTTEHVKAAAAKAAPAKATQPAKAAPAKVATKATAKGVEPSKAAPTKAAPAKVAEVSKALPTKTTPAAKVAAPSKPAPAKKTTKAEPHSQVAPAKAETPAKVSPKEEATPKVAAPVKLAAPKPVAKTPEPPKAAAPAKVAAPKHTAAQHKKSLKKAGPAAGVAVGAAKEHPAPAVVPAAVGGMAAATPSTPKVKAPEAVSKALPATDVHHKNTTTNKTHKSAAISAADKMKEAKLEAEVKELKRQLAEAAEIKHDVDEAKVKIDEAKEQVKAEEAHVHAAVASKAANTTAVKEIAKATVKKASKVVEAAAKRVEAAVNKTHKQTVSKAVAVNKTRNTSVVNKSNGIAKVPTPAKALVVNTKSNRTIAAAHRSNAHGPNSLADFYMAEDAKEAYQTKSWHWEPTASVQPVSSRWAPLSLFWRPPAHWIPPDFHPASKKASLLAQNWHLRGGSAAGTVASMEKTAEEAHEDMLRNSIAISDAFSDLEATDAVNQKEVKREDQAARQEAHVTSMSNSRTELAKDRTDQVHIGKVFTALEHQDDEIQHTMDVSGDFADYGKLKSIQDASMAALSSQLAHADASPHKERPLLRHSDKSFEAKAFHEAFANMERADVDGLKAIKRNPDLRMIQKDAHTRRLYQAN